jgi:hypothetical protein
MFVKRIAAVTSVALAAVALSAPAVASTQQTLESTQNAIAGQGCPWSRHP